MHRNWSSVCIDATGGAAKKFDYNNNRTSAIFLYEIVINFFGTSVSVFQVLSEVHDADYITVWLKKWLREVKLPPHEVVSDGSRALLNAVSLAFNNRSLSDYNESCFNNIKGITTIQPNTYIRMDTAHFIHAVSLWKCWKSVTHKNVKSFYLYCIALLIECDKWEEMERILILMLIICCTEYEDTVISYREEEITPRDARVELETLIGNRKIKVMVEDIEEKIKSMDIDSDKKDLLNDNLFSVSGDNLTIASWASHLTSYPTNILLTGKTLNCFYVPLFKDPLIKNVKEFPLWTKVCIPSKKLRPSSSYIEEDFKDLKIVLAKQITLPARIDIFVKAHLKYLLGGVIILQNKFTQFVDNNIDDCTMSIEDSNLHDEKFEEGVQNDEEFQDSLQNKNWRGLGNDPKHAKSDWANYDNNDNQNDSDENSKADGTESEKLHSVLEINEDEIEINLSESIKNDHDYTLIASTPLSNRIDNNNKLDNAIDKVSREIKKEGKYFQDCPEIKLINDLIKLKKNKENIPTIQKKGKHKETYLLINGNKSGPVLYQGIHYIAYNTCPLDSIIQILYNGALENQSFTDYLSSSKNPAFLLTINLLKKGVINNPKIYEERFSILHQFYKALEPSQKVQGAEEKSNKTTTVSRVIDCEDNVTSLWDKLFKDDPSLIEIFTCVSQNCNYQLKKPTLGVNYQTLLNNGIKDLQNALIFRDTFKRFCPVCSNEQTCEQKPNVYIYIELDVRMRNEVQGLSCKLRDIPIILNIQENSIKTLRYRFV